MSRMRPRSLRQRPVKQPVAYNCYLLIRRKWIKPSHDSVTSWIIRCSIKKTAGPGGLYGVILCG